MKRRDRTRQKVEPPPPPRRAPDPAPGGIVSDAGESPVWHFIGGYLLLVLMGYVAFRHPSAMVGGNEMSVDRAMFTSVNAATLTGFQQPVPPDAYRLPGRIAALLLTIAATVLTLIAGGIAVNRIARMGFRDRTIIITAAAMELAVILIGLAALTGRGRGPFEAVFQAASAFGNGGLHVGALPGMISPRTHLVLMPLSLLGALGVPVLLTIGVALRRRERPHPYARLVLLLWAGSYVVGLIALGLLSRANDFTGAVATASVQSINSRTTGLPFPLGNERLAHWVILALMAVGGVSGAAAGGIKLTTLARIWSGARAALRGDAPGRVFAIALTWVGLYALLVFGTLLALLATNPDQPGDRLLFLAVSAASNVGLAHNPVAIVGAGMFILSGAMLLGRILPLVILWWTMYAAQRDENPELPVG